MTMNALHRVVWIALLTVVIIGCAKRTTTPPPVPPTQTETPPTTTPPTTQTPPTETPPAPTVTADSFSPAFFDYDSYSLREDARTALDRNAKVMRDNPDVQITIEGHCDERGTVEYNQALGERRAAAARDYLTAAGIAASRIQIVSYGKERPFASGADESSWQQNRRAHFTLRT